jgi:hypothetical protein
VPPEGEEPLGLHLLDGEFAHEMLVAGVSHTPRDARAGREGALHLHVKPGAELLGVGKSAPHARGRGAQGDLLLDAIAVAHEVPSV